MTPQAFHSLVEHTFDHLRALYAVKAGEYATDADRLSNFRGAAQRTGMTSEQVLLIYLDKHYASICNYIRDSAQGKSRPRSEPINGRVDDMIVYLLLFKALLQEASSVGSAINDDPKPRLVWDASDDDENP